MQCMSDPTYGKRAPVWLRHNVALQLTWALRKRRLRRRGGILAHAAELGRSASPERVTRVCRLGVAAAPARASSGMSPFQAPSARRAGPTRAAAASALVLALAVPALPLSAQDAHFSIEPVVAYRGAMRLYDHRVDTPLQNPLAPGQLVPGRYEGRERLALTPGIGVGARVSYSPARHWTLFAQGVRARARHEFRTSQRTYDQPAFPAGSTRDEQWSGRATALALSAGVGRTVWAPTPRTAATAEILGGYVRAGLATPSVPVPSPSLGVTAPVSLGRYGQVDARYDVPSVGAGFAVRHALHRRVGLHLRAGYTVGRVDTHRFRVARIAGYEAYQEPTRYLARSVELGLGAQLRLR